MKLDYGYKGQKSILQGTLNQQVLQMYVQNSENTNVSL